MSNLNHRSLLIRMEKYISNQSQIANVYTLQDSLNVALNNDTSASLKGGKPAENKLFSQQCRRKIIFLHYNLFSMKLPQFYISMTYILEIFFAYKTEA